MPATEPARIGERAVRLEDDRFLKGRGRFVDDITLVGEVHAVVVRSPHAHARIVAVETDAAAGLPEVVAVLTAADLSHDGLNAIPCVMSPNNRDGSPPATPARPILARDRVRTVGDPVALVVAESEAAARDAADAVAVTYEPLPAVVDAEAALAVGAPLLHDEAPANLCVDWEIGDAAAVEHAVAQADHVVTLSVANQRIIGCPMEPRGAIGTFDAETGCYTLYAGTQGVHRVRDILACHVLGVPDTALHVVTPDVGGAFGVKLWAYPEYVMVLWAARRLGRPVRWRADRGESMLADHQGRDIRLRGQLALDATGRILGLAVDSLANLGAYTSNFGPSVATTGGTRALVGPYITPALHARVRSAFTNTTPTDAYRGAGRPETVFLLERLLDVAARELGIDPIALRRRNLIPNDALPYKTPLGQTYDSGDFETNLDTAAAQIGYDALPARRAAAKAEGRLRGIGFACYVDPCGAARDQWAAIRLDAQANATILVGSQTGGQGHETAYAQIVSHRLGIPLSACRLVQGDSDRVPIGRGTSGSRSLPIGGNAVLQAADAVIARGVPIAAGLLESAETDVMFDAGHYGVRGTDRRVSLVEVLRASLDPGRLPAGAELGLDADVHPTIAAVTYANGSHACEVEIEPETGTIRIERYVAVDDFGTILNPMLAEGQRDGGIAQGIGQALIEHGAYDPADAQLLAGSFMDYALPRADDLPMFDGQFNEIPCTTNALGVKGCGEAGAIVAPPAFVNAVVDALRDFGVSHVEMPVTPEKIWRLIANAEEGGV